VDSGLNGERLDPASSRLSADEDAISGGFEAGA
jgi:hypothetical protein